MKYIFLSDIRAASGVKVRGVQYIDENHLVPYNDANSF